MRAFRYERPSDRAGAIALVAGAPDAVFLGGGTNLVDLMKLEVAMPELLVDVHRLTSDQIEGLPDGGLRIGAAVRNTDLAADLTIRRRYPMLSQAILSGASGQLRNVATVGGNLLQRTRCVYFQDLTTPCNKRQPTSGCSALDGHQRDAAILGDAVVRTEGPKGERAIPLTELHRLPGTQPERDSVLEHGELITAVDLPRLDFAANSHYRKVRDRASYAFALVSVAAALDVVDGTVRQARIALGGVAHKPWRAHEAERELEGAPATEASFRAAAEAELEGARPLPGNAFKVALARNTIVRVLSDLTEGQR